MSLHLSSGLRHSRSSRRLSARSAPPFTPFRSDEGCVWLPAPARLGEAAPLRTEVPLRNLWMSAATCAKACERRDAPEISREFRLALACLTDLYALASATDVPVE